MGARKIFFPGVGSEGVWWTEVPAGFRGSSPVGVWGPSPRSWQHFLKMMLKYFVYWGFRQHLQRVESVGAASAHACGCPWRVDCAHIEGDLWAILFLSSLQDAFVHDYNDTHYTTNSSPWAVALVWRLGSSSGGGNFCREFCVGNIRRKCPGGGAVVKVHNQRWGNATLRFGSPTMLVCLSLAL